MKRIECWLLESQGETHNFFVARFASESEARKATPKAGGYGPEIRHEVITIYDTAIEFAPDLDTAARESGLAKLTDNERAALGLS